MCRQIIAMLFALLVRERSPRAVSVTPVSVAEMARLLASSPRGGAR